METLKKNKTYNKFFYIYGHRGVPSLKKENTISSFQKAIDLNYDGIELDVQITKDNQLIVYHNTIERQSKKKIINCSYKEIIENNKTKENSNKIPLLSDVLNQLGHKTTINIEIKKQGKKSISIVKTIIKQIKDFSLTENTIISSFNPTIIRKSKKIDDRIQTAWIWGDKNFHFYNTWNIILNYFKPDSIHIKDTLLSSKLINKIHSKNMKILAYTVNDVKKLANLIELKIDGIFTDYPAVMKASKTLIRRQN